MTTVFEHISQAIDSDQLSVDLAAQANVLTDCSTRLDEFKQAPELLSSLGQTLNGLPISDFGIGTSFSANFDALGGAIPTDISSVTGSLENGIQELTGTLSEDISQVINELITTLTAISNLMKMDFVCADSGGKSQTTQNGVNNSGNNGDTDGENNTNDDADNTDKTPIVAQSTAQLQQLKNMLDMLPEPFNVPALLDLLAIVGKKRSESTAIPGNIPLLDDIIDTAETLTRWKQATAEELQNELVQSIDKLNLFIESTVTARFNAISTTIASILPAIDSNALVTIADTIAAQVNAIADAVRANDIASFDLSELDGTLDDYTALLNALSSEEQANIEQVCHQVAQLPLHLEDEITHLVSLLRPNIPVGDLANVFQAMGDRPVPSNSELEETFQPLKDWLENFMETLNVEAISEPLQQVSTKAQAAITELEQGLGQVTVEVRSLLSEFEQLLDQIDVESIKTEIQQAINKLGTEITQLIESIVEPLNNAVQETVTALSTELDNFSAQDIEDAINSVIQELVKVFENPDVKGPLEQISTSLKAIETKIEQASFAPVTDQVIEGLDDIAESLKSIDTSALNDLLKTALATALKVLPDSLEPVTDPLLDEFDELIAQGPVPVMETAKAHPERLFDMLHGFKPATLLEQSVGKPYNNLLTEMEAYRPTQLLQPLQNELDGVKQRLKNSANPATALQQLSGPYNSLLQQFDQLQPSRLTEPLNKVLEDAIEELLTTVPVDDVLSALDDILEPLQEIGNLNQSITLLADRIEAIGTALDSPDTQIESWLESILDKVEGLTDLAPLQLEFDQLKTNLDKLAASSLQTAFTTHTADLSAMFTTLEPGTRLNKLLSAYSSFPDDAFQALPDSPQKHAIQTALARFDPLEPAKNRPYRLLANCQQSLSSSKTQLEQQLSNWDQRYLGENTLLATYRIDSATSLELRQWLEEELDRSFITLFKAFLQRIAQYINPIADLLKQLAGLSVPVTERLDDLLLGPGSLQGIRDAFDSLIAALRSFNLDFFTDAVDEVFKEVKAKLDIIDPQTLTEPLNQQFENILQKLDLNSLISQNDRETLDQGYLGLMDKLRGLSPGKLAENTIQPAYEQKILPIIERFNFTSLLDTIIERLRHLAEELKNELKRVNQSFGNMKNAVPLGVSGGAGVSV